ncbi:MAG: L-threonylcarbamoyladenylate synthase [Candidatus Paceibacterota bacterium]|jgi:L-threonylcarbamoyladenylate synthase
MELLSLDLNNKEKYDDLISKAAFSLKSGKVLVYPTDTLYGLGANAFDAKAILNIFKIKRQDRSKPISIIARDIPMAKKIACIDSRVEKILKNIWPGPITIILRKKDIIPHILTANGETIGVRIPAFKFVNDLMSSIDFPITATSANISGEKNLLAPKDILSKFFQGENCPDVFIDAGKIRNPEPSTIIDLTTQTPKIVRIGVVGKEKMLDIFKKFI